MRFNKGIHNILVERCIASENTAMLFMCFYGAIRQTNMAIDSINSFTADLIGEIAQAFAALISQKQQNLSYLLIRD